MLKASMFRIIKNKQPSKINKMFEIARQKHEAIDTPPLVIVPKVSEIEQEAVANELKQIDNSHCVFSSNKKGEITCSNNGHINVYGNPTKKCKEFPCSFYDNIVKSTKLIHEGADQFGKIEEDTKYHG